METLERFRPQPTVVLTTFKRDGSAMATPVSLAVTADPSRAYVRTWRTAGKAKRIRNNAHVSIAPATRRGRATGPAAGATARLVTGREAEEAARRLRRRQPILHGLLVPLAHKLKGYETQHYEIRLAPQAARPDPVAARR